MTDNEVSLSVTTLPTHTYRRVPVGALLGRRIRCLQTGLVATVTYCDERQLHLTYPRGGKRVGRWLGLERAALGWVVLEER